MFSFISASINNPFNQPKEVKVSYVVMHNKKIDDLNHSSEVVAAFNSQEKAIDYVTEMNCFDRDVKGFDWFSFVEVEIN